MAIDNIKYGNELLQKIFNIRIYINALTNIIYAIGIYYIPMSGVHDAFLKDNRKKIFYSWVSPGLFTSFVVQIFIMGEEEKNFTMQYSYWRY